MEYKLVIKDYNSLYIIYLTKLYKVLVGIICEIIIILNNQSTFYSVIKLDIFNKLNKVPYSLLIIDT